MRDAAYSEVARVGREAMHFRPPAEQNEHKVTCGVQADVAGDVCGSLQRRLARRRVAARVVTSGAGTWRFVDLIPAAAGKCKVRRRVGVGKAVFVAGHLPPGRGSCGGARELLERSSSCEPADARVPLGGKNLPGTGGRGPGTQTGSDPVRPRLAFLP